MKDRETHDLLCKVKLNFAKESQRVRIVGKPVGSLTVEGLPAESKEECGKIDLPNWNLTECIGKIRVRPTRTVTSRSLNVARQ